VSPRTALVVGVGGIGTPCAWALADAGVERLVLVDGDVVEPSNLPRQVLFSPDDVGLPKAEVAARRLARPGLVIEPIVARFDEDSGPALLSRAGVAIDATDGAATKDLVNALAVESRRPLVHAAAIGSEGRVLDGPPGGKPCIACLFGRLAGAAGDPMAAGTCADLGVWNGVTGAVGFLAAHVALARLARPDAPSGGLRVLDFGTGRCVTLSATAEEACPVCGPRRERRLPAPAAACAAPTAAEGAAVLDLTGESCPMNLLLARRALDPLPAGASLEILLGEEGAASVPDSLSAMGHELLETSPHGPGIRLRVRKAGTAGAGAAQTEAWLRRYARQIVMPEVGEAGQRKIAAATVRVEASGDATAVAAVYLAAAGVGRLEIDDGSPVGATESGRWPYRARSAGRRRDESLASAGVANRFVREAVPATSPEFGAKPATAVVREGESATSGALACADACARADEALRRVVGAPARAAEPVFTPDGRVSSRRLFPPA
jgi:sulfur carrier protein ThiS adenylyltransferase